MNLILLYQNGFADAENYGVDKIGIYCLPILAVCVFVRLKDMLQPNAQTRKHAIF